MAFIILCMTPPAAAKAVPDPVGGLCRQAHEQIESRQYDSALISFQLARREGMSKDSLLYLFAEVFRRKGALDTALALNFSAGADAGRVVRFQVLEQRRSLYAVLGWDEEAGLVADTLQMLKRRTPRVLIPGISASINAGCRYTGESAAIPYPLADSTSVPGHPGTTSIPAVVRGAAAWKIPVSRSSDVRLGLFGMLDKSHYRRPVAADGTLADSLESAWGFAAGIPIILEHFSAEYEWTRKKRYYGDYGTANSVDLGYFGMGSRWIRYISTEYTLESYREEIVQTAVLTGYFDQTVIKDRGFTFLVMGLGYVAEGLEHENRYPVVTIPNTSGTTPINFLNNPSAGDTLSARLRYPRTYLLFSPAVDYSFRLSRRWSLAAGLTWNMNFYPERYVWYEIGRETEPLIDWMAYNTGDGTYRLVESFAYLSWDQFAASGLGPTVVFREKRRVDNTVQIDVSSKWLTGRVGSVTLSGRISRTWSTLGVDAPVTIPEWECYAGVSWQADWNHK